MTIETDLFRLRLPEGWRWYPDADGGAALPPGDPGAMVFCAQPVLDVATLPSLRRMLAGFLTERGQPVTTLQLLDVEVGSFRGLGWHFVEEAPRGPHAWSLWIAGNRRAWLLVTYNCPAEHAGSHAEEIDRLLATVELAPE